MVYENISGSDKRREASVLGDGEELLFYVVIKFIRLSFNRY